MRYKKFTISPVYHQRLNSKFEVMKPRKEDLAYYIIYDRVTDSEWCKVDSYQDGKDTIDLFYKLCKEHGLGQEYGIKS
jgi:hypothetical protein